MTCHSHKKTDKLAVTSRLVPSHPVLPSSHPRISRPSFPSPMYTTPLPSAHMTRRRSGVRNVSRGAGIGMASWLAVYGNKCVHKRFMVRLCREGEIQEGVRGADSIHTAPRYGAVTVWQRLVVHSVIRFVSNDGAVWEPDPLWNHYV